MKLSVFTSLQQQSARLQRKMKLTVITIRMLIKV